MVEGRVFPAFAPDSCIKMSEDSSRAERGEDVLGRLNGAVFGVDADGRTTYADERGRSLLETTGESPPPDEAIGRPIEEVLPDDLGSSVAERCAHAMETQSSVDFVEYDDALGRVDVEVYPSETGVTLRVDADARNRARSQDAEAREAILRDVHDVVSDQDVTFEERVDRLLAIGQEALDVPIGSLSHRFGDEYRFEIVRSPTDELQSGDVVDLEATNCERVILTEETLALADIEQDAPELTDKAGFTEWGISCYLGTPVVVGGDVYGTFCFYDTEPREEPFTDWEVTLVELLGKWVGTALERKLARERLVRQNERLEQFASVVSHDLRNPLSVAEGWTELARKECDSDHLAKVADAHDRMADLIDDIRSMAQAGELVDEVDLCDLTAVAEQAWSNVATPDATLEVDSDATIPADESRLQQLLENLYRNAVEHGGDDVTVRLGVHENGFYVEDTGIGFPDADPEELFEFGYTTSADGSGLGLNLVKQISAAHGWTVELAESTAGGARVEFTDVR